MEMNMDFVIEILTEYLHRERSFDDGPTSYENALVSAIGFLEEIKLQDGRDRIVSAWNAASEDDQVRFLEEFIPACFGSDPEQGEAQ